MTKYIKSSRINEDILLNDVLLLLIYIFVILFLITIALSKKDYSHEVVSGIITLFVVGITAWLAIDKYHREQRTSRIQKLYFEESFLGQIKAMEETMSHITQNFKHIRAVLTGIHQQDDLPIDFLKKTLLQRIDIIEKNMSLNFIQTDFKKETISSFFYKTEYYNNKFASWIKQFEDDAFYFQDFLDSTLITLKILTLDRPNLPPHAGIDTILNNLDRHYLLMKRHYILFTLLSEIVLELSNEFYKSINALKISFQEDRYKNIIQFSEDAYKNLIEDFNALKTTSNNVFIDESTEEKLRNAIELTQKQMQERLFPNMLEMNKHKEDNMGSEKNVDKAV